MKAFALHRLIIIHLIKEIKRFIRNQNENSSKCRKISRIIYVDVCVRSCCAKNLITLGNCI